MSDKFAGISTKDGVRGEGDSLILGILAGVIAALIGAALWMAITVVSGFHIGYVALGVGALVGFAIRAAGNGSSFIFGVAGAVLTFLSCLAGEFLATIQLATTPGHDFYDVLMRVNPVELVTSMATHTDPIMWLIYAIGIFEGYKLSIRKK
jgi:phosphate/sulfate permease